VNPEKYGIHIIGHWNYTAGVKKDMYVISSAPKVELQVNGKSLGFAQKSDGFLFTFREVAWQPGTITALGYDEQGKKLCDAAISTVGEPAAIRLSQIERPAPFMANGHDLSLVEVEVVDAKGMRCPTALHTINFTLGGPAEWRGGMAQGPDNYILSKTLPVENGVNRVLIRSTNMAGKITISATADGLQAATLSLTSVPFEEKNGLSIVLPSASLPCRLDRGPTPLTPSYKITRTPVAIVKATAGAHADSAFASYDDNELSDWVNDGKLSTAWIEYELEREATVSEITLKLNNFRSRAYPLVITVDGKKVFAGTTRTTLGYYTIACKPQKGKKVRIQLATLSKEEGGEQMVEVSGKKLDDGVARDDSKAKGTLSIIEAEIYER
jgi:beta-galactosidase